MDPLSGKMYNTSSQILSKALSQKFSRLGGGGNDGDAGDYGGGGNDGDAGDYEADYDSEEGSLERLKDRKSRTLAKLIKEFGKSDRGLLV